MKPEFVTREEKTNGVVDVGSHALANANFMLNNYRSLLSLFSRRISRNKYD